MNHLDTIEGIARRQNGFVTAADVTRSGVPRRCLAQAVGAGLLVKVERGLYMLPDGWEDEFLILQHRFKKGVFSHETALFLHGMTDRTPAELTMTFPAGYNTTNARSEGIIAVVKVKSLYGLGVVDVGTPYGNKVRAYDIERTLCDIVRGDGALDVQLVNPAMKRYAATKGRNVNKLLKYAKLLGVEQKIKTYMGVLL